MTTMTTSERLLTGALWVAGGVLYGWWVDRRAWARRGRPIRLWWRLGVAGIAAGLSWSLPRAGEDVDDLAAIALWQVATTHTAAWRRMVRSQHAPGPGGRQDPHGQDRGAD